MGSVEGIKRAMLAAGFRSPIERSALEQFINEDTKNLGAEHREIFEKFLFQSRLGRALCTPKYNPSDAETLIETVLRGDQSKPKNIDIDGLYFLYHGSYLRLNRYAVHVLEIREVGDDRRIEASLTLKDNITVTKKIHYAPGCVTFFGELPQIVFGGSDSRVGVSLITVLKTWSDEKKINGFVGKFFGMTDEQKPFDRICLARRSAGARADTMSQETGVFQLDKLPKPHREAVDELANIAPEPLFPDPITQHPHWASRSDSAS